MIFSARQIRMLTICISRNKYTPLKEIATLLNVSKRTVLREIKGLNHLPYNLVLDYDSAHGIRISGSDEDKESFKNELTASNIPYSNKEERRELLILELLRTNEIRKIYYYSSLFNVSEATISNDLEAIEQWFEKEGLTLNRKTGVGISVSGKEENYRQALVNILKKGIQDNPYYKRINIYDSESIKDELFSDDNSKNIYSLLNKDVLDRVLMVFNTYNHELELDKYAKASYFGLIIHLTVAIDRILKKDAIETNDSIDELLKDDYCLKQAKQMAEKIENEFEIDIPEGEISFIALHIKGAKINEIDEFDEYLDVDKRDLVRRMIQKMDYKYQDIFNNDQQLLTGLTAHLKPTIVRIKYGSEIINPFKEQIKTTYADFFRQAEIGATVINEEYGINLSDDEIAYIAMHLGASCERDKYEVEDYSNVRVGIVCASGVGLSALLLARLKKQIGASIDFVTLSVGDVLDKNYDVDVLVSTLDVKTEDVVLMVNPLLTELDILNIKELVKMYSVRNRDLKKQSTVVKPLDIIKVLRGIKFLYKDKACVEEIYELIANNSINSDPDMLIRDLKKREEVQSNIYTSFNFALFHCISSSIEKAQVIFVLSDGYFNEKHLKDIKFILVLLAPVGISKSQKKLLALISQNLLEDEKLFDLIIKHDEEGILDELAVIYDEYLNEGE